MVSPQMLHQSTAGHAVLQELDNSLVDRVLVLLQPASHVVGDGAGVVDDGKVGILVGGRLGLGEAGDLAQGGLQLLLKRLVSGLGEEGLFLKNGPYTHGFLKHDDAGGKIHAEVNHGPVNALLDVLLLLHNKHVVVEELLKLLIDKVDGDLLEAVVFKDLKAGNVEDSAKVGLLHRVVN